MAKKVESKTGERPLTMRERTRQVALYLEPDVYDQLRALAFTERVKMHSLLLEGVEAVLKKRAKRTAA